MLFSIFFKDIRTAKIAQGRSINLALSNRGINALRKVGVHQEILKYAIPMKGRFLHNLNGKHKSVPYDSVNNQCINSVERNFLNKLLLSEAEKYPNVHLHFNHKLINADLENGIATLYKLDTGETIEVRSDLIIGADGAFSTVRRFMQQTPLFTFSQTYIDHGYIELCINEENGFKMVPNHLHIWPRGKFMLIALPNHDKTWTVTIFMPLEKFEHLNTPRKVLEFFENTFPDVVPLIGKEQLVQDFLKVQPSSLVSIKCSRYHLGTKCILIGDAAHAMVPFYGQGMNTGFEDCFILDKLLEKNADDIQNALKEFTETRREDAHAICDLAMYNYIEMRDLVTKWSYHLRKKFDNLLFRLFPNLWIPLYNSVTFSNFGYRKCIKNREWQDKIIWRLELFCGLTVTFLATFVAYKLKTTNFL